MISKKSSEKKVAGLWEKVIFKLKEFSFQLFFKMTLKGIVFSIFGIGLTFLILELTLRLIFPVSDSPDVKFNPKLGIMYEPDQTGYFIKGANAQIKGRYSINSDGWNFPRNYDTEKPKNTFRIAVVGDSFVEALQVSSNKGFPYLLEKNLNNEDWHDRRIEVYAFGHAGASAEHYAHMLEYVGENYHPDFVIINIVADDFTNSLYGNGRKDNWLLKHDNGKFEAKAPEQVSNLYLKKFLRNSALIRFLTINLDLINQSPILNKIYYAETRQYADSLDYNEKLRQEVFPSLAENILTQYQTLGQKYGFGVLATLDTDRATIYTGQDLEKVEQFKQNKIINEEALKLSFPLLNLSSSFLKDWQQNHERFDWSIDYHWNERGHQIVADTITKWFSQNQDVIPPKKAP